MPKAWRLLDWAGVQCNSYLLILPLAVVLGSSATVDVFAVHYNFPLNDSMNLTDHVKVVQPTPTDIGWMIVVIPIAIPLWYMAFHYKRFASFVVKYYPTSTGKAKKRPPETIFDETNLASAIINTSNNLRTNMAIYGLLLSFMVASKLSLAFSSWTFTIWAGWILAILVRSAAYSSMLTGALVVKDNVSVSSKIDIASKFYRHSTYFLILSVALIPAFFLAPEHSKEEIQKLPWAPGVSILSVASGIIAISFVFYRFSDFAKEDVTGLYMNIVWILAFSSLIWINQSPLDTAFVTVFDSVPYKIPTIAQIVINYTSIVTGVITTYVYGYPILNYIYQKYTIPKRVWLQLKQLLKGK